MHQIKSVLLENTFQIFMTCELLYMILGSPMIIWSLIHIIACIILFFVCKKEAWKILRDTWRLLRWIFVPTIILHAFFTPGEIIILGMPWAISYEGLRLGLQLALHLMEIYFLVLVMNMLLPLRRWLAMLMNHQYLSQYVSSYAYLFPKMIRDVRVILRRSFRTWRLSQDKWLSLPKTLMLVMVDIDGRAKLQANRIWHGWNQQNMHDIKYFDESYKSQMPFMFILLTCLMILEHYSQ